MNIKKGQRIDIEYNDFWGRPTRNQMYITKINKDSVELKNIHIESPGKIILRKELFTPAKIEKLND